MQKDARDRARIRFLVDRLAILLVVAKMRYGNDWNPFFRDTLFDEEGSLGDEIRGWPEYQSARNVIAAWVKREDNRREADGEDVPDAADAARVTQT
jgi:hypothetical protein